MAVVKADGVLVCVVCVCLIANGEYNDGTDAAERCARGQAYAWENPAELVLSHDPECDNNHTEGCGCSYYGFSWSPCEGCENPDSGDRYYAAVIG